MTPYSDEEIQKMTSEMSEEESKKFINLLIELACAVDNPDIATFSTAQAEQLWRIAYPPSAEGEPEGEPQWKMKI